MTRVRSACFSLALVVLFGDVLTTAPAWAQQATAELNGRVTDSSGAVLPGVTVTATQTATGLVRTVVTDGDGRTSVAGVYAAGDAATERLRSVAGAIGTGSRAALAAALDHLPVAAAA